MNSYMTDNVVFFFNSLKSVNIRDIIIMDDKHSFMTLDKHSELSVLV